MSESPRPDEIRGPGDLDDPGKAIIARSIRADRSLLLADGRFGSLIAAWQRHTTLWDLPPDGLSAIMMRQGLAAISLHLSSRPRDEQVAWTINIRKPPTNLFLAGEVDRSAVTGRIHTDGVRVGESSRLYVQARRARQEPRESFLEILGLDILGIFEQYYERSEQNPARFFEIDERRFLMVQGLPGSDRSTILSLDRDDAIALLSGARPLESRSIRFDCGCNPHAMLQALRDIFARDPEDLFRGEERVEASCPRCARRWWVTRDQFFAGTDGSL